MRSPLSRLNLKAVHRVPVDRGPLEYFAALVVKLLVKHSWPSRYVIHSCGSVVSFHYNSANTTKQACRVYWDAVASAIRLVSSAYRLEINQVDDAHDLLFASHRVSLSHEYVVTDGRKFRKVSDALSLLS